MTDQPPVEKKRSKRIYVYWGAAFALLLALGCFSWLVLRPVLEVRRWLVGASVHDYPAPLEAMDRLGGPERAAAKLSLYLRLAARSNEEKRIICYHLGFCGPRATPALVRALGDGDLYVRYRAAEALGETRDPRALEPLSVALRDKNQDVRCVAARSLGWLGDRRAIGPLEAIPVNAPGRVGEAAAHALKMIRARDLDYCLRLARSGKGRYDDCIATIAITRFHVHEGMSRKEVVEIFRGIPLFPWTENNVMATMLGNGPVPQAFFKFDGDRLAGWSLSYNVRTLEYPGEKYKR